MPATAMTTNQEIAGRLEEVARLLAEQGANRFRVQAYTHAADRLRTLPVPVTEIFEKDGLDGLESLPGVGVTIAHAIRDVLLHGRLGMLERLRGEADPIALLTSVPGIGKGTAWRLHDELGIETLAELEMAAHDGRLARVAGMGAKRIAGIRDSLAHRLGRLRHAPTAIPRMAARTITPAQGGTSFHGSADRGGSVEEPSVAELLDVDREYREQSDSGKLPKIAPRRFNPKGEAWLPILHTARGTRHYTALYSNTAHAHQAGRTHDWVVLFFDDGGSVERQCTVITSQYGTLKGRRIIRGRETDCLRHYGLNSPAAE